MRLGFSVSRLKTGTPPRILRSSIDFSRLEIQNGDEKILPFSFDTENVERPMVPCYLAYTNQHTHDIIRQNIGRSPLYSGKISGIGPRYCPSIEDKVMRFAERERHQLFVEPEGLDTDEMYLNGFSSSLPEEVQDRFLRTLNGFENAVVTRPGYAVEYDFIDPTQLTAALETKAVAGLFTAGQINGTSGYEEAAGQGLVAGINAHINCFGGTEFVLHRDEAYIGVLIDDLTTKGVDEPYRMFTSRSEFRILLRQDSADIRLTPKAFELGLASNERKQLLDEKNENISAIVSWLRQKKVLPSEINSFLDSVGSSNITQKTSLYDLLLRPNIDIVSLSKTFSELREFVVDKIDQSRKEEVIEEAEVQIKYGGYIERERLIADKANRLEYVNIPSNINYDELQSLSTEAKQKLKKHLPKTIGQASRISGVSPSDINTLIVLVGR